MTRYARKNKTPIESAAVLHPISANRKLSPVEMRANGSPRLRPVPVGPKVASTYVSLKATCPSACPFRDNGCYVTSGFYAPMAKTLDEAAAGLTGNQVIEQEAHTVEAFARQRRGGRPGVPQDGGKHGVSGRDLRLHVGGDAPNREAAARLAKSAVIWRIYGGGRVWTYTHNWREIKRPTWGEISVLASVETPTEITAAMKQGYAAAIVADGFKSKKAYQSNGRTITPCPAETVGTSCIKCRLCLNADALRERNAVIAFAAHGFHKGKVKGALEGKKVRRLTGVA
jgi:hypothetical protein